MIPRNGPQHIWFIIPPNHHHQQYPNKQYNHTPCASQAMTLEYLNIIFSVHECLSSIFKGFIPGEFLNIMLVCKSLNSISLRMFNLKSNTWWTILWLCKLYFSMCRWWQKVPVSLSWLHQGRTSVMSACLDKFIFFFLVFTYIGHQDFWCPF